MEKEFTNGELVRISARLEAATAKDIVMPPKIAYKIIKNKLAIKQALQAFETARNEIIDRESGGRSTVDAEQEPQLFGNTFPSLRIRLRKIRPQQIPTLLGACPAKAAMLD